MENNNYQFISLEKKGKIAIVKFNRPEKKNALSEAMRTEIIDVLDTLKEEKRVKAVIFYGGEDYFSAGFDKDEVQAVVQGKGDYQQFVESNHLFHQTIFEFPKLLIAAVNGYALAGAFDLTIICHLRVASKGSLFGHPEIRFGACPLFFPYMTLVGRGKALEITLNTGTRETFLTAEEAYRLNIINKLVEKGEVLNEALNLAKKITQSPEYVVKQLIQVNNIFFDQVKTFDTEIDTILKSMSALLGL
ncbi:MAG: enoyl-CoA hydratase/isomerase family protein [Candidatus Lokiarchaeota archaeon]|nr:enoyl-CoA hydratase/isomerase family protein [Candidatus Lokiarchaeota archaeon]